MHCAGIPQASSGHHQASGRHLNGAQPAVAILLPAKCTKDEQLRQGQGLLIAPVGDTSPTLCRAKWQQLAAPVNCKLGMGICKEEKQGRPAYNPLKIKGVRHPLTRKVKGETNQPTPADALPVLP